jgi:hypothetical protein
MNHLEQVEHFEHVEYIGLVGILQPVKLFKNKLLQHVENLNHAQWAILKGKCL